MKYSAAVTPQTSAYDLWVNQAGVGGETEKNVRNTTSHYMRSSSKQMFTSNLITQASIRIYNNEAMQKWINFNVPAGSDNLNWFTAANWASSVWTKPGSFNYFSIVGDTGHKRTWQITTGYNNCPGDSGILTLPSSTDICRTGSYSNGWYATPGLYPYIPNSFIYYTTANVTANVRDSFVFADAFAVFVDSVPDPTLLTPTIGSVNPIQPRPGGQITITGTNFYSTQGTVALAGSAAVSVVSWTETKIVATLPIPASSGNLVVRNLYGLESPAVGVTVPATLDCASRYCPARTVCNVTTTYCDCLPQFTGDDCMTCAPNMFPYGLCNKYCDNTTCNGRGKCDQNGNCVCNSPNIKLNVTQQDDCKGTATVAVVGGVGPYSYELNGNQISSTSLTGLSPGRYTFQVIDSNLDCKNIPVDIILPSPDTAVSVSSVTVSNPFCDDGENGAITGFVASNGKTGYSLLVNELPYTLGSPLAVGKYNVSLAGVNSCVVVNGKIMLTNVKITCNYRVLHV
jgi:hypothetical protein